MKKTLIVLAFAVIAASVYAATQQKNTAAGLQIGTASDQKIGFWGAAPTNQLTVTTIGVSNAAQITNIINALIKSGIINTN